ncbi:MAG: hypothetical protein JRD02_10240 [Deltaproteobacteria bacterium]|nr:hypothetical protein [Deltaproteobacteria bacterium]
MKSDKSFLVRFLLWGLCFFLVGCATNKVAMDLVDYVNQGVLNIAELEKHSLERYASVTGKNYTTDERVYEALKVDVIPQYKRFLDSLRKIRPKTEEVNKLHGVYIRGAEYLYRGFKAKKLGLERKDEYLIRAANEKIEKGRMENEKWRNMLIEICKKHGVGEKKE